MKAVFAGAFDPFTLGHRDIAERTVKTFGNVTVAVACETGKNTLSVNERKMIVEKSLSGLNGVTIESFEGLFTDYLKKYDECVIVRGLRSCRDLEYERDIVRTYKALCGRDAVFFITSAEYEHVSSTTVRELVKLNGELKGFVAPNAEADIIKFYSDRKR